MQKSTARYSYSSHHFFTCANGMFSPRFTQNNTASCIISQRKTVRDGCCCFVILGFVCVNLRDQRETYWGFFFAILLEYSHVIILPQIAQITQRNAAGCIISQRKTDLDGGEVCCFGVRLRNLRDLRETLGLICADRLSTLMCYSPADGADHAEEYSKLYYFAEKDRFGWW